MLLRRILSTSAVGLLALACEPPIPKEMPPGTVAEAVFDPAGGKLPLPNDLLFQNDPTTLGLPAAQAELLTALRNSGGFPNDQEVPVTIDFVLNTLNADGSIGKSAPTLDLTSITPQTVVVFAQAAGAQGPVALDPVQPADYAVLPDHGTLTLHHAGRQPWAPGKYGVLVRGGPNGVRATTGPIYASQVFYFVAQGQDMTLPKNLGLLAAQAGSQQAALAQAQQLNQLIQLYQPLFAVANQSFPQQELAVVTGFTIAPAVTQVQLDPGRGLVPLPIDLLRDPRPGGKLTPVAACTLAGARLDATGKCLDSQGNPSGAAAGFATLDGFSTTGAMLAPASELIQVSTLKGGTTAAGAKETPTILLFDLSNPAAPVRVDPQTFITEPCEFTSNCDSRASALSPVIALQPAGATSGFDPEQPVPSVFRTRPLKDNTDYAIVITNGVKDKAGHGLGPGTVGKILLFDNPLSVSGKSQLSGIDDNTAGALEIMRQQLKPVLGAAAALTPSIPKANIAMAYTFHTQSILGVANLLGALPYGQAAATALPGATVNSLSATDAFAKYGIGIDNVPSSNIQRVLEATITTFNLLDPATGAFLADPTKAVPETINVLIAVPTSAAGPMPVAAPLMVFRHGLGRGRADMLTVADTFAGQGFITVAIDAAKHGDRSFCTPGVSKVSGFSVCAKNGTADGICMMSLPPGAQGDASPPGVCDNGFNYHPVDRTCFNPVNCPGFDPTKGGIPFVSGNYLVSANFFRTRDTLRQDIIDQSQLIRVLAVDPTHPPAGITNPVFNALAGLKFVIDPTRISFTGQSLGAIQGTLDVATNPRISAAVLNVGGGTTVDIFTNSPAFKAGTDQLLAGLGITPGTPAYLQFLVVAKTILDPADPINFAGHITQDTLPDLLQGAPAQAPKKLLTQVAFCDQVVPNPFNFLWASTANTGPNLSDPGFGGGQGTFELFFTSQGRVPLPADLAACPAPGGAPVPPSAVTHGFYTDWADGNITAQAQTDAATFIKSAGATLPPSLRVLP